MLNNYYDDCADQKLNDYDSRVDLFNDQIVKACEALENDPTSVILHLNDDLGKDTTGMTFNEVAECYALVLMSYYQDE